MTVDKNTLFAPKKALPENTVKLLKKLESKPQAEIMNHEALRIVRALWPAAFQVASPRPLKVGIHRDMENAGLLSSAIIAIALRFFTNLEPYLETIQPGAQRIDLTGQPAGRVRLREAVDAEIRLFQQSERRNRKESPDQRTRVIIQSIRLLSVKKPA